MQALRALLHRYRLLALALLVCALVIKATVPAGYMLGQQGMVFTVEVCADALPFDRLHATTPVVDRLHPVLALDSRSSSARLRSTPQR